MKLAAGAQVTASIRLVRRIGEGGMGSVWEAEHAGLGTRVAVKFIAPELLADSPNTVARFQREAMAVAQIKSRHVVQVFDHGSTADGTPYLVMELLEGESLHDRLDREGTLPLGHVRAIVEQTARALEKAHQLGVIHRDIKPDNVFLVADEEPYVKVLDFGVAKHTQTQGYSVVTATGAMVGTPAYMSPEQVLSGKNVDPRTDVWSLACVAYHMLVGQPPFDGETLGAVCVAISSGVFTPPSERRDDVPPALDVWMQRALARSPDDRFASAKEMAARFGQACEGAPPSLRGSMPQPVTGPNMRRITLGDAERIYDATTLRIDPPKRSHLTTVAAAFAISIVAIIAALIVFMSPEPTTQDTAGPRVSASEVNDEPIAPPPLPGPTGGEKESPEAPPVVEPAPKPVASTTPPMPVPRPRIPPPVAQPKTTPPPPKPTVVDRGF